MNAKISPERAALIKSHGMRVRRPVADKGMRGALEHIRGYEYSYRKSRTRRDQVTPDSRAAVTLASMNMVTDIAEVSEKILHDTLSRLRSRDWRG